MRQLSGRVTRIFDTPYSADTAHADFIERQVFGDDDECRRGLFDVRRIGGDALARRHDVRRRGAVYLSARRDERQGLVERFSADAENCPRIYEAAFSEDKAVIKRTELELDDAHGNHRFARRQRRNSPRFRSPINSSRVREIEITSYAEIVLARRRADAAHPAFSNLFVETEFFAAENSLIAKRRPRAEKDEPMWAIHTIATDGETVGAVQYETDRARFLGRGHDASNPLAIIEDRPLSNTVGAVLDPIFSLRRRLTLSNRIKRFRFRFQPPSPNSYEEAQRLADKYHDPALLNAKPRSPGRARKSKCAI